MLQHFIVAVATIIYKPNGSMLVTERSEKELQAEGMLSYCSGKIDTFDPPDQDYTEHNIIEETAKRELMEECGVIAEEPFQYLGSHAFQRLDGENVIMIVVYAKFKEQKEIDLDPEEIKDVHWMKFEDIPQARMYPAVYKVYTQLNQTLYY